MKPNRKHILGWLLSLLVVAVVSFHAGRLYQHREYQQPSICRVFELHDMCERREIAMWEYRLLTGQEYVGSWWADSIGGTK